MAVPKKKTSRTRRDQRRSHHALKGPGLVPCPNCGSQQSLGQRLSVNALKVLRFFQENDCETANRLKIDEALGRELEVIMRSHIKYLLEHDVKSVEWLDNLRAQMLRVNTTQQSTS